MKKICSVVIVLLFLVACSSEAKDNISSFNQNKEDQNVEWVTATNGNMNYKVPKSWVPEVKDYYVYYYPLGKSPLDVMFYMYYSVLENVTYSDYNGSVI